MSRPYFSPYLSRVFRVVGLMPMVWAIQARAIAQIVPDATLPDRSTVIPDGNIFVIDGGTVAGSQLFHSFERFDLPTGFEALFENGANIDNIFSRVTGESISNIDGLIRANGTANLFLLNPNGILFGPNAQLDIGGSFFASTAESLLFENGGEFSAANPNGASTVPLLTVSVPIGVQFGPTPGAIVHRSIAPSLLSPPENSPVPRPDAVGLEVRPGRSITLLGGNLHLEGGHLTTSLITIDSEISQAGAIELGSIAGPDRVGLTPTATGFEVGYDEVRHLGNIELSGGATVNADGLGGGRIRVRGDRIFLDEGSILQADTWGALEGRGIELQSRTFNLSDRSFVSASTFAGGGGGGITLYASESVDLTGTGFNDFEATFVSGALFETLTAFDRGSGLFSVAGGSGNAGNITIDTQRLTLAEGAVAITPTFERGAGGSLTITASEFVEIAGSSLSTGTARNSMGNAGNITLDTQRAIVRDGGSIQAFTLGDGSGGNILLRATESVELLRTPVENLTITGIATTTVFGTGDAGNITVETERLRLEDGAEILTTSGLARPSLGTTIPIGGRAGTLIVRASESVELLGSSGTLPSGLVSGTFSAQPAGDLTIETGRLIVRDGAVVSASTIGVGNSGNLIVRASERVEVSGVSFNDRLPSSLATVSGSDLFSGINSSGTAGKLQIETDEIIVRDRGQISVSSLDTGDAGTLDIEADSIALDNKGAIAAATSSGAGGNITLRSATLQFRNGSSITTNAGNTNGGNITLETDTLVALENSDITANAQQGRGGRVEIAARGVFGTEFRSDNTLQSDITATSELGAQFNGIVTVRTPDIDPSAGVVQLPSNLSDPADRIVNRCGTTVGSTFSVVGRGGLPEDPTATVRPTLSWSDARNWRELGSGSAPPMGLVPQTPALVEATGWIRRTDGTIELVSQIPDSSWSAPLECDGRDRPSVRSNREKEKGDLHPHSSG